MIKNFFFIAFRNYLKNKVFVVINVIGLSIAMACCIVAYLNYRFEADFNKTHVNCDTIYKISVSKTIDNRMINSCVSPVSLAPAIEKEIAGIDRVVRYSINQLALKYEGGNNDAKIFNEDVGFADKDFLKIFTFPLKFGYETSFEDPNKILLSEETSNKFFGDKNPVGEALTLFNNQGTGTIFTVGGVFKEIPHNSIIRFSALLSYSKYLSIFGINEFDWKNFASGTFLQVTNHGLISGIEQSLARYIEIQNKNRDDFKIEKFYIQNLHDFTKTSGDLWDNRIGTNVHPAAIYAPAIMAIFLILLTCFNFINTAIASSNRRLKEIGIRKVIGGSRKSLIVQFLGENFFICLFALLISLLLGVYLTGEFNKLMPLVTLSVNYFSDPGIWIFLGSVLLVTTLFSAFYPALYVSSFNPIQVIRGTVKFSGNGFISKSLLVLQFGISLLALISGLIMTQNGKFQKEFDYGYNRGQTIIVPGGSYENIRLLQANLSGNPDILKTTITNRHPEFGGYRKTVSYQDKKIGAETFEAYIDYCKVLDLEIIEGRDFSAEFESSDVNRSALVNVCLVKELKMDDPIGKVIKINDNELIIVGVTEDFYEDIFFPLLPAVIQMKPKENLNTLIIKGKTNDLVALNKQINKEWERLVPNAIYSGNLSGQFKLASSMINTSLGKMYGFLSIVSIFLSLIALYTLISQTIIRRTKEIGIRKVVGSSSFLINILIGKSYLVMLLISSVLGGVGGYFINKLFLDSIFKFHSPITMYSVLIPVVFVLVLSFITLTSKVYHTLSKNPINSLKDE